VTPSQFINGYYYFSHTLTINSGKTIVFIRWEMLISNNSIGKEEWLKSFSKSSVKVYVVGYEKFIMFMNQTENGDWNDKRLVKERETDLQQRNYAFEGKIVEFYQWLNNLPEKLSDNSKKTYVGSIRSFFAFHRLDLKFTKQQRNILYKHARPARKYYEFMLDDLRKMSQVASPKERYVLLVGKSLGLRASDFIRLKQGTFEAHLKGEAPMSLGEIYTKKEGVKASPFLDEDAIEASKIWLRILESKGKRDPEARMVSISEQEVDLITKKLVKKARINTGNEIARFHQLRVFLCTRLSSVTSESRWKQIVGKTIQEGSYIKPFLLKNDYAKVLPLTTLKEERVAEHKVNELKEEIKTLKERENTSQSEITTMKEKMQNLEKQFNELKEEMKKLEWRQYYSLSEAFGTKIVRGKDAERVLEELEESIEQSENEET